MADAAKDFNDINKHAAIAALDAPAPPTAGEAAELGTQLKDVKLEYLLQRYAQSDVGSKIWDNHKRALIKKNEFISFYTKKNFDAWFENPQRRAVLATDVMRQLPKEEGGRGLAAALTRYVYLKPSDMAWDKVERELIPLKDLRFAIADCFDDWLKHPLREDILRKNLVFDPTQQSHPKTHINTFRGLGMAPGESSKGCANIQFLLLNLCNDDRELFMWLRRWLALPLQQVGAKMASAVLIHSDVHGSGKSLFFDVIMRKIYGEYGKTVGQQQLESQYNEWIAQTLYCCYEEVLTRGQKYSHTGTLKQIITGGSIRIEKKFTSGWEESNHMNCVFLSNEVLPLPVEPSDRRYFVVWPEKKLDAQLQHRVMQEINGEGVESFYKYLLETDMTLEDGTFFNTHTQPPMTAAKHKLIDHGLPSWEVFYNAWKQGQLQIKGLTVPFCTVRVCDLFVIFDRWCTINREHGLGAHKFTSFMTTRVRKRPSVHYDCQYGGASGKSAFFIIEEPPAGMNQGQFFANCVAEFERLLNKLVN